MRELHAVALKAGYGHEELSDLASDVFQVESMSGLSVIQIEDLIKTFRKSVKPKGYNHADSKPRRSVQTSEVATAEQLDKIVVLWQRVCQNVNEWEERLDRFVHNKYGVKNGYKNLGRKSAQTCIITLNAMLLQKCCKAMYRTFNPKGQKLVGSRFQKIYEILKDLPENEKTLFLTMYIYEAEASVSAAKATTDIEAEAGHTLSVLGEIERLDRSLRAFYKALDSFNYGDKEK
jgi:hypothetical protein